MALSLFLLISDDASSSSRDLSSFRVRFGKARSVGLPGLSANVANSPALGRQNRALRALPESFAGGIGWYGRDSRGVLDANWFRHAATFRRSPGNVGTAFVRRPHWSS